MCWERKGKKEGLSFREKRERPALILEIGSVLGSSNNIMALTHSKILLPSLRVEILSRDKQWTQKGNHWCRIEEKVFF